MESLHVGIFGCRDDLASPQTLNTQIKGDWLLLSHGKPTSFIALQLLLCNIQSHFQEGEKEDSRNCMLVRLTSVLEKFMK